MSHLPLLVLSKKTYKLITLHFFCSLFSMTLQTNVPSVFTILSLASSVFFFMAYFQMYKELSGREYSDMLKKFLIFILASTAIIFILEMLVGGILTMIICIPAYGFAVKYER